LNIALNNARGRFLIRVDAHAVVREDYVERAVRHLSAGTCGGVGGIKTAVGIGVTGNAIAAALGSKFGVGGSRYHYADQMQEVDHVPFGAYVTRLARQIGGWDERMLVNQDFEFDYRFRQAGNRLIIDPEMVVQWAVGKTLRQFSYQYFRYGLGRSMSIRLHPRSIRARHVAPVLFVVYLCLVPLMAFVHWATTIPVMLYALLIGLAPWSRSFGALQMASRGRVPAVLACMHLSWGAGLIVGLFRIAASGSPFGEDPFRDRDLGTHAEGAGLSGA
jgi:succinoglycan biosynthesis protein ExoA